MSTARRKRGFTLIELLVVVGIVVVLIALLVPLVSRALEQSRRAKCGANVRAIAQTTRLYGEERGEFPRTKYDISPGSELAVNSLNSKTVESAFTCPRGSNPYGSGSRTEFSPGAANQTPANNDVTAAMFVMVRLGQLSAAQFICPSGQGFSPDTFEGGNAAARSNFTARKNLSYSFAMAYPGESTLGSYNDGNKWNSNPGKVPSASHAGYKYGKRMKPSLALVADLNPGDSGNPAATSLTLNSSATDMKQGNSSNHARAGQNVAFADGHVEWVTTPFVSPAQDNMYTRAASVPDANGYDTLSKPTPDHASSTVGYDNSGVIGAPDPNTAYGKQPPTNPDDAILLPTEQSEGLLPYKISW